MDGLKEGDFFGLGDRFWMVSGEGIDFREGSHGIEEAIFDLRVCNIVRRCFENVEFVASASGEVGLVVKGCHDGFNDFELGEQ